MQMFTKSLYIHFMYLVGAMWRLCAHKKTWIITAKEKKKEKELEKIN